MSSLPHFLLAAEPPPSAQVVGRLVASGLSPLTRDTSLRREIAELRGFTGAPREVLVETSDRPVILVGVGEEADFGPAAARRAAALFARSLGAASEAALDLRGVATDGRPIASLVQAVVEGVAGATYRYERYKSAGEEAGVAGIVLVVDEGEREEAERGRLRGTVVAEAVAFARDLVNTTAGDLTPRVFADKVAEHARAAGLLVDVLDKERITTERLGGLLGVARGSSEPPRLVLASYEPDGLEDSAATIVLVGKGITFDSGGLSLKPADGMMTMKCDMSGAATVLAVAAACPGLGVRARVVAIAPVTENMPGGSATKPGDVLEIRNGKTIEVLNTDAEGRLILADGLVLATERDPDAIVDVATLTGACVVALGGKVAGVMGNDGGVVGAVEQAADRAGEQFWRLPLPRSYRADIDSEVADMKNMGKPRQAGALVAGLLLEEFVDDRPWAHLDIAGPAFSDEDEFDVRKGGTGFGVRTLIEFVSEFSPRRNGSPPRADHRGVGR